MAAKKSIYPVFLPHAGCPFRCVYCNQNAVTLPCHGGDDLAGNATAAMAAFSEYVRRGGRPGEIAFFGGTFTALDRPCLVTILEGAARMVAEGIFTGIRFSTRPDCLGAEVLDLLRRFPVRTVELGVQSMADEVLDSSARGYTERTVREAAARVRQCGWSLGIQLMAGLPGDRPDLFLDSVRKAIGLAPDFFRFYPTLVLRGTVLARHFLNGSYAALDLEDAIEWVLPGYDLCLRSGIPVARMGLHADPALEEEGAVLGGPLHPAFGHLVRCRWWRKRIDTEMSRMEDPSGARLVLRVPARQVGDIAGPERANIVYWKEKWGMQALKILADKSLTGMETVLERH